MNHHELLGGNKRRLSREWRQKYSNTTLWSKAKRGRRERHLLSSNTMLYSSARAPVWGEICLKLSGGLSCKANDLPPKDV